MRLSSILLSLLLLAGPVPAAGQFFTYSEYGYNSTDEIFTNPERGFSAFRTTPLSIADMQNLRAQNITLIQRIHTIPQFNDGPLSDEYLELIEQDFITARQCGMKMLMRFSYTNSQNGADAPLWVIETQLDQLQPLFEAHYDVIAYIEAGFIGAWGEWFYSTNNLNNTEDRQAVLYKILDVLPPDRMTAVRTPAYKQAIFGTSEPLDEIHAFNYSYRARTGAHNDCFLASYTDYGTYNDVEADKDFLNLDNRFVPQGGETCNPSEYSECSNALIDLARMRYSQLNSGYHMTVLNSWETGGCMPEIKRRLGYRFVIHSAFIQDQTLPGGPFEMDLVIENIGFASPYNPRSAELVMRNSNSGDCFTLVSDLDPRFWMAGETRNLTISGGLSADFPEGEYQLLLNLPDPLESIHDRPEYSIRLANENMWEEATGYNDLGHTVTVSNDVIGLPYGGNHVFVPTDSLFLTVEANVALPEKLQFVSAYPNPFNGRTAIEYRLDRPDSVRLQIFDLTGSELLSLDLGYHSAGSFRFHWHPDSRISSGIYLVRVSTALESAVGRLIYLK